MIVDGRAVAAVAVLTMIWGSSFFLTTLALDGFHPMSIAFSRLALAAVVLVPLALISGAGLPQGAEWRTAFVLGAVGLALPQTLLAYAQRELPSGTVSIFIAAVPLFTLVLAWLVLGDVISKRRWAGFAIGFVGLLLLAGPTAFAGFSAGPFSVVMAIFAAVFYAVSAIAIRGMKGMHPFRATAGAMIMGSAVSAVFGIGQMPASLPPSGAIIGLVALGLFPTGLAQILRYYTVRRSGPVFSSIVGYLIPIWAGFLGVAVLDEAFLWRDLAAYGLILTGLLVARERRKPS